MRKNMKNKGSNGDCFKDTAEYGINKTKWYLELMKVDILEGSNDTPHHV